jgi:hypothetical protein
VVQDDGSGYREGNEQAQKGTGYDADGCSQGTESCQEGSWQLYHVCVFNFSFSGGGFFLTMMDRFSGDFRITPEALAVTHYQDVLKRAAERWNAMSAEEKQVSDSFCAIYFIC